MKVKKAVEFRTFRKYCSHGFARICRILPVGASKCNARNCPVWKRLTAVVKGRRDSWVEAELVRAANGAISIALKNLVMRVTVTGAKLGGHNENTEITYTAEHRDFGEHNEKKSKRSKKMTTNNETLR